MRRRLSVMPAPPKCCALSVCWRAGQRTAVVCIRRRCAGRLHLRTKLGEGAHDVYTRMHAPQACCQLVFFDPRSARCSCRRVASLFVHPARQDHGCYSLLLWCAVSPVDGSTAHRSTAQLKRCLAAGCGCVCRLVLCLEDCKSSCALCTRAGQLTGTH